MNDKAYNMYLKMVKLACNNIKSEICRVNQTVSASDVQIKIRNKNQLVKYVEQIAKNTYNAVALYSNGVEPLLVVSIKKELPYPLNVSVVFIESIIASRTARVYQKQLIDYTMAEMYLTEAYNYDVKHPCKRASDSALEKAKKVIEDIYSITFLSNFIFDGSKPHLDENIRNELKAQAFDTRYAFTNESTNDKIIRKKYASEFGNRQDFFLMDTIERNQSLKFDAVRSAGKTSVSAIDMLSDEDAESADALMITELYKTTFADLPLQKRRRKFVNLKVRNRDIMLCPRRNLISKKQYANIESLTKYHYIYDFFDDQMPGEVVDVAEYYFRQEVHMYQYMWSTTGMVHVNNGKLYFPNGTNMPIAKNMQPYEFLHKINTVYAALFGFSPDDMRGGKHWLYDTIRRAYTDEGTADYRLAMIDAKLNGKI